MSETSMSEPSIPEQLTLTEIGWKPFFEHQVSDLDAEELVPARVCAHHGGHILFLTESGEVSVPTAIVESDNDDYSNIAVGDWFLLQPNTHRAQKQLQRNTVMSRKAAGEKVKPQLIAANVDTVFIVSSCNQEFSLSRLERYLALVLESGATPVVVLTKADLAVDADNYRIQTQSLRRDLIVETINALDTTSTEVLEMWCGTGKTIALVGSSGVGKSTLANALGGYQIMTGSIREDDAKGRHTTTSRAMYRLKSGGWLIDNPGMRELQLADCEAGVREVFDDLFVLADRCKFRNCHHQGDQGCALQAAVDSGDLDPRRFKNFMKLKSEQRRNSESLAERRAKERKTGKFYKDVISEKKRRREG